MNARDIEIFRAVLKARSISGAAEVLNVSQPALSKGLRHCEDRLGYQLFKRTPNGLIPTAEAQALLPEAERLYKELQAFKGFARDLGGRTGGLLRLGATSSLAVSLVPPAVATLRQQRQASRMTVSLLPLVELGEALLSRRVDVGLSLTEMVVPGVTSCILGSVPCVVVLPQTHPLASETCLSPPMLEGETEVGFANWIDFGASIDAAFRQEGISRILAVEVTSTLSAVAMVKQGIGYAIVDALTLTNLPAGLVARPFKPEVNRNLVMSYSEGLGTSSLVDQLRELLVSLLTSLISELTQSSPLKNGAAKTDRT
ncbi:LysR family transcriptional regulator [Agrobacterium sp. LAD9]|uniref:LysR family transcriptional regulator n=1 Tax=Agrobacterium sp. LAD9 TaxID=2055153 RepID=UPI000D1EF081|nr:LysR family transcriptional regulator [Agrobacterium sp. LAD9]